MSSKTGMDGKVIVEQKEQSKEEQEGPTEQLHDRGEPGSKTPGTEKPASAVKDEKNPNTE